MAADAIEQALTPQRDTTPQPSADALRSARDAAAYDAQRAQPVSVTTMDVDRVLGMSDQFLEDWRESVDADSLHRAALAEIEDVFGDVMSTDGILALALR